MTTPQEFIERWEGRRNCIYCDACGKPFMECMKARELCLAKASFASVNDIPGVLGAMDVCPGGNPTIGVGRNLHGRPLSDDEVGYLFKGDLSAAYDDCDKRFLDTMYDITGPRARANPRELALLSLSHWNVFPSFPKMCAAVRRGDWAAAAFELLWSDRDCPNSYCIVGRVETVGSSPGTSHCPVCEGTGKDHSKLFKNIPARTAHHAHCLEFDEEPKDG